MFVSELRCYTKDVRTFSAAVTLAFEDGNAECVLLNCLVDGDGYRGNEDGKDDEYEQEDGVGVLAASLTHKHLVAVDAQNGAKNGYDVDGTAVV